MVAVRRRLQDLVNERWDRKLEDIDYQQSGLWNFQRILSKKKTTIPPLVNEGGEEVYTQEDIAE